MIKLATLPDVEESVVSFPMDAPKCTQSKTAVNYTGITSKVRHEVFKLERYERCQKQQQNLPEYIVRSTEEM